MDKKKIPLVIGLLLLGLIIIVLIGNSDEKGLDEERVSCCLDTTAQSQEDLTAKIYMEVSGSMRGYVDSDLKGDFLLKELPQSLVDLKGKVDTLSLFTITDKAIPYSQSFESFNNSLERGEIFANGSSPLQNSITGIIDSLKSNELGVFISDCIIDLGNNTTISNLKLVENDIYANLKSHPHIKAMVFQFYSDFNGEYYFNVSNNKEKEGNPFKEVVMHQRPYYVWFFGHAEALKYLIKEELFLKNCSNSYTYGITYDCCDIHHEIVQHDLRGKVLLSDEDDQVIQFKDFDRKNQISFTIGVDFSALPEFASSARYIRDNLYFIPDYQMCKIEAVKTMEDLKKEPSYAQVAKDLDSDKTLTHFITISIEKPQDDTGIIGDYKIGLKRTEPDWVSQTHISDDRNISADSMETKTFGFSAITNSFKKTHKGNSSYLELPFTIVQL